MRKVVLYTLMSLDGAVDQPAGYFGAGRGAGQSPEFDTVMDDDEATIVGAQDAVLFGRRTYDQWSQFWPAVDDEPFAEFINNVTKYVVTSTPLTTTWHNSEPVDRPVEDLVRELKAQSGGDVGVHGSIQLAQALLRAELVDELRLVVGPAFGFTGRRLFTSIDEVRRLELLSAKPTPSGSVLLAYRAP